MVHAAAITPSIERERAAPTPIVDVNLGSAVHVFEAAIRCGAVERVVLNSSSGVYGTPSAATTAAQSEHGPLQLDNLYSIAKYSAELLGARYAGLSGKSIVSARLAAPFGPLERPTGSRTHMGHPQRLLAALRAGQRVRVAGSEVMRDWTYVEDTADAIRGLLLAPRLRYPVYNVSCGVAIPFRELVDAFAAHGLEAEWVADGAASAIAMHESQHRAPLNITRLAADTGWKPRFDVRAGVQRYLLPSEAVVASQSQAEGPGFALTLLR